MGKRVVLLSLVVLLIPLGAWADDNREAPREVEINGLYCVQTADDIWCQDGGKLVKMRQRQGSGTVVVAFPPPAREEATEATRLSRETTELLASAAVKYSWSGPLKWSAISSALLGILFLTSDAEGSGTAAGIAFGTGALSLGIALAIDASARTDLKQASDGRRIAKDVYAADGDEDEDDEGDE